MFNRAIKDRLAATAVFTGIAIGGVSGMEMVIGAGFDGLTPSFAAPTAASAHQPYLDFSQIDTSNWSAQAQVQPIAHWVQEQLPLDPPQPVGRAEIERALYGGNTANDAAESGDDLYAEIAALYARSEQLVEHVADADAGAESASEKPSAPAVATSAISPAPEPPALTIDDMAGGPEPHVTEASQPAEAPDLGQESQLDFAQLETAAGE